MCNKIDFLDERYLIEMLDDFSKSTGLNIHIVNIYGENLLEGKEVKSSEFCSHIKNSTNGQVMCVNSYKKASEEAFKWNEPYFFRCHAGLVMWAVPIIIDKVHIGTIVCGQVLLWKPDKIFLKELEQFNKYIDDIESLKEKSMKLNIISADKSQSVANMLAIVVKYLSRTNNNTFIEQKNLINWRNTIIDKMESRKKVDGLKVDYSIYLSDEKKFLQYIRIGNKDKVVDMVPTLLTNIEILCKFELNEMKEMIIDLMILISRAATESGIESSVSIEITKGYKKKIIKSKGFDEVSFELNKYTLELLDLIYILSNDDHTSILKSAKEYIDDNYDEKITIDSVSENIFISTSYLCYLFRKNLSCTVNEYITRVRIEKSIQLMKKRELSMVEIINKVGFSSQSHFTKVFKKIIGVTPGNYRNKFL
ncbi:PocR ligand-binding domain-containing protein [Clostridium sp.]|uniref:PocR ligand-binding domain-containing protein n=1 Tax=Clostridium sp. TaxID=1506 RepID=UPI003F3AB87D